MTDAAALSIPHDAAAAVTREVLRFGRIGLETGGFLLAAKPEPADIAVVALAGEAGVFRHPRMFRISALAIDVLFGWADERRLHIPAQVHSHEADAFLSPTDRRLGFNVTGFISAVVPDFAEPPADPRRWGWWRFDGNVWAPGELPLTAAAATEVVTFDEGGVRGG